MIEHVNGAIYLEDPRDFLPGDVGMTINNIPIIRDRKRPEIDQSRYYETTHACTIVNAYKDLCYQTGKEATQEGMLWFVQECHKRWNYEYGKGNYTSVSQNWVRKIWNERFPEYEATSITIRTDSPMFIEALKRGNILGFTYRGNAKYNHDYKQDGVLNGKEYPNPTYGHRTSLLMEDGKIKVVDSYAETQTHNIYEVEYFMDLVKNGVYYPNFYLRLPTKEWDKKVENSDIKENKERILILENLSNSLSLGWKYLDGVNQENAHKLKTYISENLLKE